MRHAPEHATLPGTGSGRPEGELSKAVTVPRFAPGRRGVVGVERSVIRRGKAASKGRRRAARPSVC